MQACNQKSFYFQFKHTSPPLATSKRIKPSEPHRITKRKKDDEKGEKRGLGTILVCE